MSGITDELIAWAEKATGPDRGLDWGIHLRNGSAGVGMYGDHPHYTASIDAALTLIPKDWGWVLIDFDDEANHSNANLYRRGNGSHGAPEESIEGYAKTPALAMCVAALKAGQP